MGLKGRAVVAAEAAEAAAAVTHVLMLVQVQPPLDVLLEHAGSA